MQIKRFFSFFYYCIFALLPKIALSRASGFISKVTIRPIKDSIVWIFIKKYPPRIEYEKISTYKTFGDFFSRKANRPIPIELLNKKNVILSPADGILRISGKIEKQLILQLKQPKYKLEDLLSILKNSLSFDINNFINGSYFLIYLTPTDYHRVHMPIDGNLLTVARTGSDLFPVNDLSDKHVPRLYDRNEKTIFLFKTEIGEIILILIGAMFVGSVESAYIPKTKSKYDGKMLVNYPKLEYRIKRGEEIAKFNFGSTVLMLINNKVTIDHETLPPNKARIICNRILCNLI